ncbi:MAG: potassium channel family protein [Hyphomicrobiales bacterium]
MLRQLFIGSLVIAVTVAIQAEMFNILHRYFDLMMQVARRHLRRFANTGVIIVCMLYIMFIHTIEVWLWAGVLLLVGAIDALEPAVYFSLTTYATIGFGDITIGPEWRLLSALIGANGLILFGWSVAYMVELVRRTA